MLKLGDSLSGKNTLERKSKIWLDNLLQMPCKGQKVRVFLNTKGFYKGLGILCMDPHNYLSRIQNQRWDHPRRICGGASCLMQWMPVTYVGDPQVSSDFCTSRNTAILDWKGQRENKMKEDCQTPNTLQAGNRMIKFLSCKHNLPFKWKEEWLWERKGKPRAQSLEPQRVIARPWNLKEFAQ